ncbi:MAG: hypothetical protein ACFFG0_56365 [Candidatus Thorarchaeota archaeon]
MKKKILVVISNYGTKQLPYLKGVLQEYNNFKKYKIKIILLTTEYIKNLNYPNLAIKQEIFDKSLGLWLTHKHKKYIFENKNYFDIFIYSENDIPINEDNLDIFRKHSENLKNTNLILGFLRYEQKNKYLIDCHPRHTASRIRFYSLIKPFLSFLPFSIVKKYKLHPIVRKFNIKINNHNYFEVQNVHQGSYVLAKEHLKKVLDSGNYFNEKINYAGIREGAASNVYIMCGLTKVISIEDLENSLIHHLPDSYIDVHPTYIKEQALTPKQLKDLIKKHI